MDRRVFEPRPNGNEARRRHVLSMALIVLAALALMMYFLWAHSRIVPVINSVPANQTKEK